MTEIFYAKCIRCKIEFDQGMTNLRLCADCKEKTHKESVKKGMDKQIKKRHEESQITKKCRFCYKEFNGYYGRLYCSNTCRSKFWNLPDRIEATEDHIMRLHITLEMLKSKLHGIK